MERLSGQVLTITPQMTADFTKHKEKPQKKAGDGPIARRPACGR